MIIIQALIHIVVAMCIPVIMAIGFILSVLGVFGRKRGRH